MFILPKAIYRFSAIPIKIQGCFPPKQKRNSKTYMKPQKNLNNQSNAEKKEHKSIGITHPDIKWYYKATVTKNRMVLIEKQIHWSVKQNWKPRNLCLYVQLIYSREAKNIQWTKLVSSVNGGVRNKSNIKKKLN